MNRYEKLADNIVQRIRAGTTAGSGSSRRTLHPSYDRIRAGRDDR